MIATPTAQDLAIPHDRSKMPEPHDTYGTAGPGPDVQTSASKTVQTSAPKIARNGDTPIRRPSGGKRKASAVKSESRLSVAETTYHGKKAWRVSLGKRGRNLLSFRIRPINSGFVVTWRSGNTERYVCYLSAGEWQAAKRGSSSSFAQLIIGKLEARRDAGETLDKINSLPDLLQAFG